MVQTREWGISGSAGQLFARSWYDESRPAAYIAILAHGYGEHIGRYEELASWLAGHGAAVYGLDHRGHGRSAGERVVIDDFEAVVEDLHGLVQQVRAEHTRLPIVLIGHSLGGMIATRYAQRYRPWLAALVLSGPVLGVWTTVLSLLQHERVPDTPIDPATLSRDEKVGAEYVNDPLVWHGSFQRRTLQSIMAMLNTINAGGRLEALPTLWLHGGDDRLVPIADTRLGIEVVRGSRMVERIYPSARHEVFKETNRREVFTDVTQFVESVLQPG
ncbi:alpha/beta hydrolase [Allonocardiopsis opalescens]|uniref:Alpha-beta hydrolase superfamily lysophospholipase n=1 Tax=Allonocardiopsis opalescens TaxID=1144618 RepID=A0A2T0Q497_9ACTN|nr:alpha/beta hydrolase [Allonocardiopsis opalescens]PRX98612.1 alpha-beta hydrolase superfamily lysophospholipase [Allonocardiopsis opalescens]